MLYFSKWKVGLILFVLAIGALYASPNFVPGGMPASLVNALGLKTVNLGLDLQGGSHLLYEVDLDQARADRLQQGVINLRQAARNNGVAINRGPFVNDDGEIELDFPDEAESATGLPILRDVLVTTFNDQGDTEFRVRQSGLTVYFEVTPEYLADVRQRTIRDAQSVIRRRIDSVGVTEPSIQSQGEDRILVQAPGVDDPELLKERIGTTAQLTLQLVTPSDQVELQQLVESGFAAQPAYTPPSADVELEPSLARAVAEEIARLHPNNDLLREESVEDIAQFLTPIFRGNAEQLTAPLFAMYNLTRDDDAAFDIVADSFADAISGVMTGQAAPEDQALAEALADGSGNPSNRRVLAEAVLGNLKFVARAAPTTNVLVANELVAAESMAEPFLLVSRDVPLTGEDLRRAGQAFDPDDGLPIVTFDFNGRGADIFCDLTRENVERRFASILDDEVISAPVIRSAICGGGGYIEGNFTLLQAQNLAALLNAGSLPAELTIIEERTVGPGVGEAAVRAGAIALAVGFIAVIVFMTYAYRLFGLFANISLLANVILILAVLSGLQATLTLPGIAGIILTVGMAVDANVLIFERIREELRAGRTPANAIEAGYLRARTTILDANITTFIAAFVLFFLGSGPVQGFAVTLAIGILTSVFTAFVVSRALVAWWFARSRPKTLLI